MNSLCKRFDEFAKNKTHVYNNIVPGMSATLVKKHGIKDNRERRQL